MGRAAARPGRGGERSWPAVTAPAASVWSVNKKPSYAIDSVDNALRLLQMLQRDGALRVMTAARELGVAPSTAHRLIAMLVYRGFALQAPDRSYRPGPALGGVVEAPDVQRLVDAARPHLVRLCQATQESVNLLVRRGADVLFVDSVESTQALRVGSRAGTTMPARVTSGGLALLATLSRAEIEELHPDLRATPAGIASLLSQLSTTRRLGYGFNYEASEIGVTALGVAARDASGQPVCALTVSAPTARFRKGQITQLLPAVLVCREQLEADLAAGPL